MDGVEDDQLVMPHVEVTVMETELCRAQPQTPVNAFEALQFRGTMSGMDTAAAELLLLLGVFVSRDNITGRNAPNLAHF